MVKKMKHTILLIIKFFLFCTVLVLPCFAYFVYKMSENLPDYQALLNYNPDKATYIYDSNNEIMGEIANEKRIFIPIEEIPTKLKNAFIAAEDKTFYENSGIDPFGFIKAMIRNMIITIRDPGTRYQGGSTITQQIVRNVVLSNERTASRKIKEMILAYKISTEMSKDKILEAYLNHIYLGSRSYGVAAAAKEYFDKKLNDLTIDQMALLASLPKAPSVLDPTKGTQKAIGRRDYVLRQMLNEKYITNAEYSEAILKDIVVVKQKSKYVGDAFIDYVRQTLYQNGITEKQLLTGGYKITTTMRKKWQEIAQNSLNSGLIKFDRNIDGYRGGIDKIDVNNDWLKNLKNIPVPARIDKYKIAAILGFEKKAAIIGLVDGQKVKMNNEGIAWAIPKGKDLKEYNIAELFNIGDVIVVSEDEKFYNLEQIPEIDGAVVIMSPKTGELYAMVGGYADVRGSFNRSFQAKRQSGSTAKLFSYLAALEKGVSPAEIFMDSELSYNIGDGTVWSPKNWTRSYSGPVTMRTGFEKSINTVTIRIAEKIGISSVINMMKRMGLTKEYIEPNYGICLGTGNTTLLDLTKSFAIIANYGKKMETKAISKIEVDKKIVYLQSQDNAQISRITDIDSIEDLIDESDYADNVNVGEQIISEQVAYQMISLLLGTVERGTGGGLKNVGIPIAAKTGTSQNGQSLWAIGITPDVAIGVYTGQDTLQDKDNGVFAATYTMPILAEIVNSIKPNLSKELFKVPDGIKMVKINKETGFITNEAIGPKVIYEAFKDIDNIPEEEKSVDSINKKEIIKGTFDGIY